MAESDRHLDLESVHFALGRSLLGVVSPVEFFDHAPLRARDR
jgi:hypothetical protein